MIRPLENFESICLSTLEPPLSAPQVKPGCRYRIPYRGRGRKGQALPDTGLLCRADTRSFSFPLEPEVDGKTWAPVPMPPKQLPDCEFPWSRERSGLSGL